MSYRSEFPDFGTLDVPIPAGFKDQSYRNDVCPKFASDARGLVIWVDYKNRSKREWPDSKRFSVSTWSKDGEVGERPLLETDSWPTVLYSLNTIENMRRKNPGLNQRFSAAQVISAQHLHTVEEAFNYLSDDRSHGSDEIAAASDKIWGSLSRAQQLSRSGRDLETFVARVIRLAVRREMRHNPRKNPARAHDLVDIVSILNGTVLESRIFRYIAEQNAWLFRHDGNKVKIVPHRSVKGARSGRSKTRRNPVKTFFCFPCGRRFIGTGSASQANCPDCRRVCQATRLKSRTNPSKWLWRVIKDGPVGGEPDTYYVPIDAQYAHFQGRERIRRAPTDFRFYIEEVWLANSPKRYSVFESSRHGDPIRSGISSLQAAKKYVESLLDRRSNPRRRARRGR